MSALVAKLVLATGIDQSSVRRIMLSAPRRYKSYYIAKRNGGLRKISQPAREVKVLQRALIDLLLSDLPVHRTAMAYRVGTSIKDNANAHKTSGPIIKIDFTNFFPSIKRSDWADYCQKTGCLNDPTEIGLTSSLLFQYQKEHASQRLAIGAPSSPMLSNILMYEFDSEIESRLQGTRIVYTRYADDLTFSAPRTGYLHDVMKIVRETMRAIPYPRLKINPDKTTYVTTKYRRSVTGLTLSNDGRVTIGWRKKRELHAAVHNAKLDKLNAKGLQALAGYLAFVQSVEPSFLSVLRNKYGTEIIMKIKAANVKKALR
ncbi:RNA-directed DNA polymerase [Methylobacterium sp. WL69]|uniref:retron St85 family RNA-directed DNA polymerase n=1 Tax=Methylobacterium sp. WL69 TaxID=2603893 RepID=UPI0011C7B189|nr:retron St85 family RNA-directed DNA polymerase [Methylobacterium sp. WL69]TXM72834.1 RNA-directed DNA polymerase [Methylobacterium sp. WL69]